jgi:hypothetical protein
LSAKIAAELRAAIASDRCAPCTGLASILSLSEVYDVSLVIMGSARKDTITSATLTRTPFLLP